VWDVLHAGAARAREEARRTMALVREAMHLVDPKGGGNEHGYEVKLERFEGPLDLLMHLIQRDEIDIYDIRSRTSRSNTCSTSSSCACSIWTWRGVPRHGSDAHAHQARMLLPTPQPGEEEEIDPRDELVQRLLEYRQFKEAAGTLKTREEHRRLEFERGLLPDEDEAGPLPLAPATLFHLLDALNRVLARLPARTVLELEAEAYDIEERIESISNRVRVAGALSFETLLSECRSRLEMIVTFLALLELLKLNRLLASQEGRSARSRSPRPRTRQRPRNGRLATAAAGPRPSPPQTSPKSSPRPVEPRMEVLELKPIIEALLFAARRR